MATILKESLEKSYRAGPVSCSFFLCSILSLIAIIVPFFLARSTYDFWSSSLIYEIQPIVLSRNEIIITAYSLSQSISGSSVISTPSTSFYSTLGELNQLSSASLSPVDISSSIWDYNADYKPDMYDLNITIYIDPSQVRNLKVFANFQYQLRGRVNMDMTSLAIADINTPQGASSVFIDGTLRLKQKNPLKSSRITRSVYNYTLLDYINPTANYFPLIFNRYNSRNETTFYQYQSTVLPDGRNSVLISMKIRIPSYQQVWYIPLFLQNLKFAWIQYLSLLIPIGYLVTAFAGYVFSQQIFETFTEIKY